MNLQSLKAGKDNGQVYFTSVKFGANANITAELNVPEQMDPVDVWFFKITRVVSKGTAGLIHIHSKDLYSDRSYNNTTKTNDLITMFPISTTYSVVIDPILETSVGFPVNGYIINNPNITFNLTDENYASYTPTNVEFEIAIFKNPKS